MSQNGTLSHFGNSFERSARGGNGDESMDELAVSTPRARPVLRAIGF